jgi:3-hydroxyacyl-[acyl-carrier-protein] dehydratase
MKNFDTEDPNRNDYALLVFIKNDHARYRGLARLGDVLVTTVWLNDRASEKFDFAGTVSASGKTFMKNRFRLMDIVSSIFQKTG